MKLVRTEGQAEIKGEFEELANTLALWHGENSNLYEEVFSQIARGEWLADIPPEICVGMVRGMGLKLLNDDGTPASQDTVERLGRRAWERLQEIVDMEVTEEL